MSSTDDKLQRAMSASGVGLYSWDVTTGEVTWNARLYELTGLETPVTLEDYVEELVHPADREEVRRRGAHTLATGEFDMQPHRILRPDGEVRWVVSTGALTRDADGRPIRLDGGIIDVSDQRRLEEQLWQSQKLEAVGSLTAGIAHNFNNMLMAIIPALDMYREDNPDADLSLIEGALDAATRAAAMIEQLMTFAGHQRNADRQIFVFDEVVAAAVELCRQTFDRNIELRWAPSHAALGVLAHPGRLEQVIVNVLLNARDALTQKRVLEPRVEVVVRRLREPPPDLELPPSTAGYVCVAVRDNAGGVPEEIQQRIFEPFFTTKAVGDGTGLGLATSYAIARNHQGALTCRSDAGWAVFELTLPVADAPANLHGSSAPPPEKPRASATVLLVEDEPVVSKTVSEVVRRRGHRVIVAGTAEEASRRLAEHAIDLVLLDLSLPGAKGETLLPEIRERRPGAAVIVLSGQPVAPAIHDLVHAVLEKPTRARALQDAVDAALERA